MNSNMQRSKEHYARIVKKRIENTYARSEKHFWERVKILGDDECWEWQRCRNFLGYGKVSWRGRLVKTHRLAYLLTYGSLCDKDWVLHKCDNPPCCNPRHLYKGDHAQNTKDAVERHAYSHGSKHKSAKLTEEKVIEILKLRGKFSGDKIGFIFGVGGEVIRRIFHGTAWKHVDRSLAH